MKTNNHIYEAAKIPGFGQSALPEKDPYQITERLKEYAAERLKEYTAVAVGGMAGGSLLNEIGAVIGGSLAVAAYFVSLVVNAVWHKLRGHSTLSAVLPPDVLKKLSPEGVNPVGTPLPVNLRVIQNVRDGFEWRKKLIESAEQSIEFTINFGGGENLRALLDVMKKRMEEKKELKIHLICSADLLESKDYKKIEEINKDFKERFHFFVTDRVVTIGSSGVWSEENHSKFLIVDEKYFFMGGSGVHQRMNRETVPSNDKRPPNLAANMIAPAFRDVDIVGKGEDMAATMRTEFFKLYSVWEQRLKGKTESHYFPVNKEERGTCVDLEDDNQGDNQKIQPSEGEVQGDNDQKIEHHSKVSKEIRLGSLHKNVIMRFFVGGPEHRGKNPITAQIATMIRNAKKSIKIANFLFTPVTEIKKALEELREEKVKITAYCNGVLQKPVLVYPGRANYDLCKKVYEYHATDAGQEVPRVLHKKVMVIDDQWSVIGSYNLGSKSSQYDNESIAVIDSIDVAAEIKAGLKVDRSQSETMVYPEGGKKAVVQRTPAQKVQDQALGNAFGFIGNFF